MICDKRHNECVIHRVRYHWVLVKDREWDQEIRERFSESEKNLLVYGQDFRLDIHSGEGKPNVSDESSAASVQSGNDGISREACF